MTGYRAGKIPADALDQLLERHVRGADGLIVPPGVGRDAALVELGGGRVVAAADPITFASEEIGWYAVHVNANDVVCLGARPRWFVAVVLLPESRTDRALVDSIFAGIAQACADVGAALCGGHTEVTPVCAGPSSPGRCWASCCAMSRCGPNRCAPATSSS